MNRLLENAFNNRFKGNIFNLNESTMVDSPVTVAEATWEHLEDVNKFFIKKDFGFENIKVRKYFISEVMNLGEKYSHDPVITIDGKRITIVLYTKDLNDVTYADTKLAKDIDDLANDINESIERSKG